MIPESDAHDLPLYHNWRTATQSPRQILDTISQSPQATIRILAWLDTHGVAHSGRISGATLASVCGVDPRTWRKWITAGAMPKSASRLLFEVARI